MIAVVQPEDVVIKYIIYHIFPGVNRGRYPQMKTLGPRYCEWGLVDEGRVPEGDVFFDGMRWDGMGGKKEKERRGRAEKAIYSKQQLNTG